MSMWAIKHWKMLSDMSCHDRGNYSLADFEFETQFPLGEGSRGVQPSKFHSIGVTYYRFRMLLTNPTEHWVICWRRISTTSAFFGSIFVIISRSSYKEVKRIAAYAIIAMMTYAHAVWYLSKNSFIGKSVRRYGISTSLERAVTRPNPCFPRPAGVQFSDFHFAPKKRLSNFLKIFALLGFRGKALFCHA